MYLRYPRETHESQGLFLPDLQRLQQSIIVALTFASFIGKTAHGPHATQNFVGNLIATRQRILTQAGQLLKRVTTG